MDVELPGLAHHCAEDGRESKYPDARRLGTGRSVGAGIHLTVQSGLSLTVQPDILLKSYLYTTFY